MKSPIEYLKVSVTLAPDGDWDAVMETALDAVTVQTLLRKMILDIDKRGNKTRIVPAERRDGFRRQDDDRAIGR